MVKNIVSRGEIHFRPAKPIDADAASRLLFTSFPKLATFIIGLGDEARAKHILQKIFPQKGHRFSYEFTEVVLFRGGIVGVVIAFPGRKLGRLNRRLAKVLIGQYRLRGKLALLVRALPLAFIKEATGDEYYLGNIAVKKRARNRGIGRIILEHVEDRAKNAGLGKVALMVSIDNQGARRLYERLGYHIEAINLESNARVAYLGTGYQNMIKVLVE